ncbi:MAG TPA: hypothetical protein VHL52_06185 [Acidimicrobiia bacterium]|nr:hypothetical protein [Acidimicrobiia bacterium]
MVKTPRPDDRGEPVAREVVELRVHGVGGTPPEEVLDVPLTRLVAGDEGAGFFRPWGFSPDGPSREAYSWGGLTSASRLRALWVLLFPFAMANLAGWMLRHGGRPTDTDVRVREALEDVAVAIVRLFGLVVTVAAISYLTVAGVDLVGYQCGTRPTCTGGRWWLSPWENRLVSGHPGRAIVVGALVAVGGLLAIAWITRRSQIAIHRRREPSFSGRSDPVLRVNLHHAHLWDSPHVAHRLGLTHLAAALATTGVTLGTVAADWEVVGRWAALVGWALLGMGVLASLKLDGVPPFLHSILAGMSGVYLAAVMLSLWVGSPPDVSPRRLEGASIVPVVLLPIYPLLALAMAGVALALWRRSRHGRLRVAFVGPALLLMAVGAVNAFGSGLLIRLADLLGNPHAASDYPTDSVSTAAPILYADSVADVAVVTVFAAFVAAVVATGVWLRAGSGPTCETLADRYVDRGGLDCDDPEDREWARAVGRSQAVASLTDQVALVVAVVTLLVLVGVALAVATTDDPTGMGLGSWSDPLAGPASVILGLVPVAAVYLISRLYRSRAVRRVVGILWDVATFWPRWFHPWSPPSYAERAVPQLGYRFAALAGAGGVVVSAHSQGSVMTVATLVLAEGNTRRRTALLTHGSPLTRLYSRYFPEYFSQPLYRELSHSITSWLNLWRATDFIGGRIGAEGVKDVEVFDPPSTQAPAPGEARPAPFRHSDYDRTDEYAVALGEAIAALDLP